MPLRDIDILLEQMTDLKSQHRWQDALQIGQTLLAKLPGNDHPKRAIVFFHIAACYNELGQYAEAETQYAMAVQEDPSDSDTWYNRANNQHRWAVSAKRRSNIAESQTHCQQAMNYALHAKRINPRDRDILNLIAIIQRSCGEA